MTVSDEIKEATEDANIDLIDGAAKLVKIFKNATRDETAVRKILYKYEVQVACDLKSVCVNVKTTIANTLMFAIAQRESKMTESEPLHILEAIINA
jgi:hypothetical protein